jgi:hypothetical protein
MKSGTPASLSEFLAQLVRDNRLAKSTASEMTSASRRRGEAISHRQPAAASDHVTFPPGSRMKPKCWEGKCDECKFDASECACLHHQMPYLPNAFLLKVRKHG